MLRSEDVATDPLLADLSEPQRQAVVHTNGPLLILAGPGSGKTRVVTRRAAHLARTVAQPFQILAITFTNKAAKEMRERIDALGVAEGMTVCTFHALCAKLLRWHHDRAGVPANFTIFDRDDRRKIVKQAIEQSGLSPANLTPAVVDHHIGRAKNAMLTAEAFAERDLDWTEERVARIYTCYEELLSKLGGLDFDDLLLRVAILLSNDAELREQLEGRYRYVLVDEYQDTNAAQYRIARLLTLSNENLCATGDPDQSIYGWRGADIENILRFERDYPDAVVVRVEQNYRSTKRILAAADALITSNAQRKEKSLWTENETGPPVRVVECETGDAEADAVARDIAQKIRQGVSPTDVAVFYRINSLSRVLEEALLRVGVAYQIARGLEFYSRKEIKDVLAYLRVLVNPADEIALQRIINTPPRGIGATTVERLTNAARQGDQRLYDYIVSSYDSADLGRAAAKVGEFAKLLKNLASVLEMPASKAIDFVLTHTGLRALHGAERELDDSASTNLDELISAAAAFEQEQPEATVIDWLEHAALISDIDSIDAEREKVTLMTLHAAKGLEFDTVYIVGLEEGLVPMRRLDGGDDDDTDLEEERRLCFVGMTRAKRQLTLSRARYRMLRGVTRRTIRSQFLDELPTDGVECTDTGRRPSRRSQPADNGRLPADIAEWTIGTLVRHPAHGLGRVMAMERGRRRTHVDVLFKDDTRRKFVLEFAELTRVDFDDVG